MISLKFAGLLKRNRMFNLYYVFVIISRQIFEVMLAHLLVDMSMHSSDDLDDRRVPDNGTISIKFHRLDFNCSIWLPFLADVVVVIGCNPCCWCWFFSPKFRFLIRFILICAWVWLKPDDYVLILISNLTIFCL